MRSKNEQKSPYSKKVETIYFSQVWNIKQGGSMSSLGGTNHHVWSTHSSYIYQPLRLGRIWHKVNFFFFKRSLTGLNSEFSFSYTSCLTKAEEPSLPHYLTIAGGRIIGFIPFPRVLVLCGQLIVLFVKETDFLVHLIMWPKRTCDVREFLKHCEGRSLHLVFLHCHPECQPLCHGNSPQTRMVLVWHQLMSWDSVRRSSC